MAAAWLFMMMAGMYFLKKIAEKIIMDLVGIINCLLEHGFLNQEDEEKPFCIDKLDEGGFEIQAYNGNSRYELIIGEGEETFAAARFKPYSNLWQLRDGMPVSVELFNESCLIELLNYWEGLR